MTFGAFQGKLRPLVEAAWNNHAGLLGLSTADKVARDAWYRDHLWAACRLTTTKAASDRQRYQLLDWFAQAAGTTTALRVQAPSSADAPPSIIDWSAAQSAAFWKLAHAARQEIAQRECRAVAGTVDDFIKERLGGDPVRAKLFNGSWHLGTATDGFDTVMSILAVDACDMYWINRTSDASARRMRFLLSVFLEDLSWLESSQVGWPYVVKIYRQSNSKASLPDHIEDCPAEHLASVLQMLDTHIRRLCARHDVRPCLCPTRPPSNPVLLSEWRFYHNPIPGHTRAPNGQLLSSVSQGVA
jgi:hypothetical protein